MGKLTLNNFKCPSSNAMYAGRHWIVRKREAYLIHTIVLSEVRKQAVKPIIEFPVDIKVTAYYKYNRRHDSPNVDDKCIIDGMVNAKLLPDDSTKYIRWSSTRAVIGSDHDYTEIEW